MSRPVQVTFDAHDPWALSSFWRDVLGYLHLGPPGVELTEGADVREAWNGFLERVGVPEDERNSRSAIEDPEGHGPRFFFQRVPEDKVAKNRVHLDVRAAPGLEGTSEWRRWNPNATVWSRWARPRCVASIPRPRWRPASS